MGAGPASSVSISLIVCVAGIVLLFAGTIAWRRGRWPKRVGDAPHCPYCEYMLTGLQQLDRCPECGADVSHGRIAHGERRLRPRLALLGQFLLVVGLCAVVASLSG